MQLIKDNLNLWGPDAEDADDAVSVPTPLLLSVLL